ncbi:MAG: glutathione transferase GstA [Hyphomonadaceae bacterium]|nr:glutathione transferase GstA [Hyphomonadaceae bacterium]
MKLYYAPGACSLAPHIVLRETGAAFTLEKVDIRGKKTETGADFLAINPKGYVPALDMGDGDVLTEGVVMQQYIADQAPQTGLAPARGTRERLRVEEWLVFISSELHKTHSPLFSPATPAEARAGFIDKIGQRYDYIERTLSDGRAYLTGPAFTVADAYLFTITNWAKPVGVDLARWPNLSAYVARVAARPAVQAALVAEGLVKAA